MGQQIQVVDADGAYQADNVEQFVQQRGLSNAGVNYTTVAIMGPQSSGKSTLLNILFGSDFKMMNAETGRSQTTQGVWLDLSPKVVEVPTLVMDLEGSDGRERGEDDTTFERQSALFALATADILMINMFAVNIGRVQGAGAPLLKTVFQVNLKLFMAAPGKHKTVLLMVIRDRTRTPHQKMCEDMRKDLNTIWAALVKPPEYANSPLDDFFEVQYVSLPSYEIEQDDFIAEATLMRRKFLPSQEASLIREDASKVPASALSVHLQSMWDVIAQQKDLNLPAHKVMVAHIRCKDIAQEHLKAVTEDQAWLGLLSQAFDSHELVPSFAAQASSLVESCLYGYDTDAMYFVESVRTEQKDELEKSLYTQLSEPFKAQQQILSAQLKQRFEKSLGEATSGQFAAVANERKKTLHDEYKAYVADHLMLPESGWADDNQGLLTALASVEGKLRLQAVQACESRCLEEMEAAVDGPGWLVVSKLPTDLWPQLRSVVKAALKNGVMIVDKDLAGYGLQEAEIANMHRKFSSTLCSNLIKNLRKHMQQLHRHLEARFTSCFEEEKGVRRSWNSDLTANAQRARDECARTLAQLAVVPSNFSEATMGGEDLKLVHDIIIEYTRQDVEPAAGVQLGSDGPQLLTMLRWPATIDEDTVLLSPADVRQAWQDLQQSSKAALRSAMELQEERKRANSRPLPLWVYPALFFFGWNEIMDLLKRPILLLVILFFALFLYQLYRDLEVDKEIEKGLPAAAINISRKIVPASRRLVNNTAQACQRLVNMLIFGEQKATDSTSLPAVCTPGSAPPSAEIEMTKFSSSPVAGLRNRVGETPSSASTATTPNGRMKDM